MTAVGHVRGHPAGPVPAHRLAAPSAPSGASAHAPLVRGALAGILGLAGGRMVDAVGRQARPRARDDWWRIGWLVPSLLIGIWTHIFWDSFTHCGRWGSDVFPVLRSAFLGNELDELGAAHLVGHRAGHHRDLGVSVATPAAPATRAGRRAGLVPGGWCGLRFPPVCWCRSPSRWLGSAGRGWPPPRSAPAPPEERLSSSSSPSRQASFWPENPRHARDPAHLPGRADNP